ncbi:MAG: hypothetical protein ACE37D_16440 [Pseudomonadales bacterium]
MTDPIAPEANPAPKRKGNLIGRLIFLVITVACFGYLFFRIHGAAGREDLSVVEYMTAVFAQVDWLTWMAIMVCYSLFYFLIDTLVVSRALSWFVKDVPYIDILPIRGSAYIVSIYNEQVGKGAMAYYLNKRHQIPGWEVSSVMLFIMFCEVFYLLSWALLGYFFSGAVLPDEFDLLPYVGVGGFVFLIGWMAFFHFGLAPDFKDRPILHAFQLAKPKHYLLFFLLRSPALIGAIVVYTASLNLFGVEADMLTIWPYLPIIFFAAAVPTPMRAAAITFWVILFPDNEGQMAAFGFVQHNFFILFNALLGLVFWRTAQKELFGAGEEPKAQGPA